MSAPPLTLTPFRRPPRGSFLSPLSTLTRRRLQKNSLFLKNLLPARNAGRGRSAGHPKAPGGAFGESLGRFFGDAFARRTPAEPYAPLREEVHSSFVRS